MTTDGPRAWLSRSDETLLDPDEAVGLRTTWLATRADLNAAEQANIARGLLRRRWARITTDRLLDDLELRRLHRDMFGEVWRWAGTYRRTEKNIGIAPDRIAVSVRDLVADARVWIIGERPMAAEEAAVRFHHRLVQIHPFPNGNGRHARAATDLLLMSRGEAPFTWGSGSLTEPSDARRRYLHALQRADAGDLSSLTVFVRS